MTGHDTTVTSCGYWELDVALGAIPLTLMIVCPCRFQKRTLATAGVVEPGAVLPAGAALTMGRALAVAAGMVESPLPVAALELVLLTESGFAGQVRDESWDHYQHELGSAAGTELDIGLDSDLMRLATGGSAS
jgi:hypothetical protein